MAMTILSMLWYIFGIPAVAFVVAVGITAVTVGAVLASARTR